MKNSLIALFEIALVQKHKLGIMRTEFKGIKGFLIKIKKSDKKSPITTYYFAPIDGGGVYTSLAMYKGNEEKGEIFNVVENNLFTLHKYEKNDRAALEYVRRNFLKITKGLK